MQLVSNITMRIVSERPIFADFSQLFSICPFFAFQLRQKWSSNNMKCAIIEVEEEVNTHYISVKRLASNNPSHIR